MKETASGPVVIMKNSEPCAALVHLAEDEDMESFMLSHSPRFLELLDSVRRAADKTKEKGGVSLSALAKELSKPGKRARKPARAKKST